MEFKLWIYIYPTQVCGLAFDDTPGLEIAGVYAFYISFAGRCMIAYHGEIAHALRPPLWSSVEEEEFWLLRVRLSVLVLTTMSMSWNGI